MSNPIKRVIEDLIVASPSILNQPLLLHRTFFRKKVAILMYHGVVHTPLDVPDWCFISEHNFTLQMEYLHRKFRVVSLTQAAKDLREDRVNEPTAVITFDDGYQNVYDVAYPILSRLGLPATVFINTGFIDSPNTVWFCMLNQAVSETTHQELSWDGQVYDLSSTVSKGRASAKLQSLLKQLPHQELLEKLADLREELDIHTPAEQARDSHFRMLDNQSIAEMSASGLIEFGAHTATHTILSRVDETRARQEISSSIEDTQRLTGKSCRLFAYPNGKPGDYNEANIRFLASCGIEAAVTTRDGPSTMSTPPLELCRYGIGANLSILPFILRVHHLLPDL
jgi:peptidoglycan/xylan/chitin deacetylase (PgdA/CDA1 family)